VTALAVLVIRRHARDAMPTGGKLTLETANVELDEAYVRAYPELAPGPYVLLAVSDTGVGMPAEVKARLFEPFFTTKEIGKGTGLGLATVYGIVKQSGGHIAVYSEPGVGTTFKVHLPCCSEPVSEMRRALLPEPPQGAGTVLLVEDEDDVRTLTRRALPRQGYAVLEARHSREALQVWERHKASVELVISDVVMPEMNGGELARRLLQERAELRVLFLSGYTDSAVLRANLLEEGRPFLQRPFTPRVLARKVHEVMSAPPSRRPRRPPRRLGRPRRRRPSKTPSRRASRRRWSFAESYGPGRIDAEARPCKGRAFSIDVGRGSVRYREGGAPTGVAWVPVSRRSKMSSTRAVQAGFRST
jgi:two-component system, cell cycle sensor histidine kinase and response regulator CckA